METTNLTTSKLTIKYNGSDIQIPIITNTHPEEYPLDPIQEYLQDNLDQLPKHITQNYIPISYQLLEYKFLWPNLSPTGNVHITHIVTFNLNPHRTQLFSRIELERAFSEAFWDPDFVCKVITTYNTITVIIDGSN